MQKVDLKDGTIILNNDESKSNLRKDSTNSSMKPISRNALLNENIKFKPLDNALRSTKRQDIPKTVLDNREEGTRRVSVARDMNTADRKNDLNSKRSPVSIQKPIAHSEQKDRNKVLVSSGHKVESRKSRRPSSVKIQAQNVSHPSESYFKGQARLTEVSNKRRAFPFFNRLFRKSASKRFRLKGFANEEYAKQVRAKEKRIISIGNIIFWIVFFFILLVIFYWINPIDKVREFLRLFGM